MYSITSHLSHGETLAETNPQAQKVQELWKQETKKRKISAGETLAVRIACFDRGTV